MQKRGWPGRGSIWITLLEAQVNPAMRRKKTTSARNQHLQAGAQAATLGKRTTGCGTMLERSWGSMPVNRVVRANSLQFVYCHE